MSVLRLPPLPTIKDVIRLYKLRAMKQLSQNFILNEQLTDKIIKKAGNIGKCHVLEVGPGPGGLTRSILRACPPKLTVIEKDKRFKPMLDLLVDAYSTADGKMEVIFDDIMRVDISGLFPISEKKAWEENTPNIHLIGNLPFSVSTALIIKWLHAISEKTGPWSLGRVRMTLTFQKEVAERLVAEASGIQRCRLSVMAQAWTRPILRFVIPNTAFLPKPEVHVAVVTFIPLSTPQTKHEFTIFEKVVRHVFSFRQKYCIRGVETLFPLDCRKEMGEMMFKLTNIDPTRKAMQLTVKEFDSLVTAYKYLVEKHPEIGLYNYRASRKLLSLSKAKDIQVMDYVEL